MKSLLVVAFVAAVALAAAEEEPEEKKQVCVPGTSWRQACNTCFCSEDGTGMGCTLMMCNPHEWGPDGSRIEHPTYKIMGTDRPRTEKRSVPIRLSVYDKPCEPGKAFKHYCNTCVCSRFGRVGRCTRMLCDESIYNEDGSFRVDQNQKLQCEPGRAYSPDGGCNTCVCNEYGSASLCTRKSCLSNSIEVGEKATKEWGPLYEQGDSCTPGEAFRSRCNQCVCSINGKGALCANERCRA